MATAAESDRSESRLDRIKSPWGNPLPSWRSRKDRYIDRYATVVQTGPQAAVDPEVLNSGLCREGLAYWRSLERPDAGCAYPDRGKVDPGRIPGLLPYTFLVDVIAGGVDFRYRLVGTDVVSHTPRDNTGRNLSEIVAQGSQAQLHALYAAVVADGAPRFQRIAYRTRSKLRSWYETVVCPLSDRTAGTGIAVLIGWAEHFHQLVDGHQD